MCATPRIARGVLRLVAAGWVVVSLSACGPSSIDADRSSFVNPPSTAAQAAARAQLSLAHHQALYELNLKAGAAQRPAASRGTFHEAYQRWTEGKVRELPDSASQAGQ